MSTRHVPHYSAQPYRGRFAPSPTGPLHFGSMVAAVGSYLEAKSQGGIWLVRIEDLDPPREMPGAASAILHTLERFGLMWDESVVYQSQRIEHYQHALDTLVRQGKLYACGCTRREIAQAGLSGPYGPVYNGQCRGGLPGDKHPRALRVLTHHDPVGFTDKLRGHYQQVINTEIGDFIVRRADHLFAYQLAVVVDDAAHGVTEVVRGSDLLDNTPRQIHLQQLLGVTTPAYAHLPVVLNAQGQKLSKQSGADAIDHVHPPYLIFQALDFLGQRPPEDLQNADLNDMWAWAIQHWNLRAVPTEDKPLPPITW